MSTHLLTVTSDTELAKAADLMTSTVVKSLPAVDRGRVVGVISRRDIIGLFPRSDLSRRPRPCEVIWMSFVLLATLSGRGT